MPYILQPTDELPVPTTHPGEDPDYFEKLFALRRAALGDFRTRFLSTFYPGTVWAADDEKIRTLVGTGNVLIDESIVDSHDIRAAPWFRLIPDAPLAVTTFTSRKSTSKASTWHLKDIDAPSGLDGSGILVGVIDTGIDLTVQDLVGATPAVAEVVGNKLIPAAPIVRDMDSAGRHGTSVCIFLMGDSAGVAKGVELQVVAVPPTAAGGASSDIELALDFLLKLPSVSNTRKVGFDVINLSRVTTDPGVYDEGHLYETIKRARKAYGTLFVASVGNDSTVPGRLQCPGAFDCVLSVGAIDSTHAVNTAWGTNLAGVPRPDIVAPGWGVEHHKGEIREGSSFAAPMVTAAAALLLQHDPTLRFDPDALQAALLTHVKPVTGAGAHAGASAAELKAMSGAGWLNLSTL